MKARTADVMLLVGLTSLALAVGRKNVAVGVMVGSILVLAWIRSIRKPGNGGRRGVSERLVNFLKSIVVSSVIMITSIMAAIVVGVAFLGSLRAVAYIDFNSEWILGIVVGALSSMPVTSFIVRRLW